MSGRTGGVKVDALQMDSSTAEATSKLATDGSMAECRCSACGCRRYGYWDDTRSQKLYHTVYSNKTRTAQNLNNTLMR